MRCNVRLAVLRTVMFVWLIGTRKTGANMNVTPVILIETSNSISVLRWINPSLDNEPEIPFRIRHDLDILHGVSIHNWHIGKRTEPNTPQRPLTVLMSQTTQAKQRCIKRYYFPENFNNKRDIPRRDGPIPAFRFSSSPSSLAPRFCQVDSPSLRSEEASQSV